MSVGLDELALVPVWAVRHRDQIRARFDGSRADDICEALGILDLSTSITRPGVGTLCLDGRSLSAFADGSRVPLTLHGFRVLEHLVTADRVVPADELMVRAWGSGHSRSRTTLRAVIHHVRQSLPAPWAACLTTVRLRGYRWTVDN